MRKISFLMAFLITGYILGIWNFLTLPKYYITFGMKGFLISLIPALVALFLIYSEAESTKRTRYLIHEFFFRVARLPALTLVLLMFLMVMLGVTTYYSAYGLIFLAGVSTSYVPIMAALTILLVLILLLLAKGKTLEFISVVSILFVLFAISAAFLVRNQALSVVASDQAKLYMHEAVSSITSFSLPLTARGVLYLVTSTVISFGLGAGVYYVLGSFMPEELELKKVLVGVFILQIILSFAAAFTVAYSLGVAYEGAQKAYLNPNIPPQEAFRLSLQFRGLKEYTTNSTQSPIQSIGVFYSIPEILKGNVQADTTLTWLLMLSLYFAGLTTIIVLMEIGSQILSEAMQFGRDRSLCFVSLFGVIVSGSMVVTDVRTIFLAVPFAVGALIAAVEAYPLLSNDMVNSRGLVWISVLFLVAVGVATLYLALTEGSSAVKIGAVLGMVLFVPLLMNRVLLKGRR